MPRNTRIVLTVLTPVKQYSISFTADNTSTAFITDASLAPISEDFRGAIPIGVLNPVVSSAFTGVIPNVTATIIGTTITFTFPAPPAKFDNNSNLIVYTATFFLQYQD